MESILMAIKWSLFVGMAAILLTIVAITLTAGLYQVVRSWIRGIQKGPFRQHKSPYPFVIFRDRHDVKKACAIRQGDAYASVPDRL